MTKLLPVRSARTRFAGAAAAVAIGSGLLLSGCGSPGPGIAQAAVVTIRSVGPHGVFSRVLDQPYVTVTGGNFYVTWLNQPKNNVPSSTLTRADQATGTIEATRTFGTGLISSPQAAGGSLWALLATKQETLLRMNPATLAVTGELKISDRPYLTSANGDNHLSVAGGALWAVAGNRLVRVSLRTGKAEKVIDLPGGYATSMAGSPSGSFLIVSVADSGGQGSLQRRDPVTGALLASHPTLGVTAASIGGVTGSSVWASQATGMEGFVSQYRTRTLAPVSGTSVGGSNGVGVAVAGGLVWVFRSGQEADTNYCASPATGKKLAAVTLPEPRDQVIGIWGSDVYYGVSAGGGLQLRRLAVPAACRA